MFARLVLLVAFATASLASPLNVLGGPAWCTASPSGQGRAQDNLTKDCCAAVKHKAYFNEVYKVCEGLGGQIDNAVDHGAFGKCCDKRGGGSHG